VDDSELMLLTFNTYEAFGALLGSPAAKAAKLTAMHIIMAVVIACACSFEAQSLKFKLILLHPATFFIRLAKSKEAQCKIRKMVPTVPVVLALACASAAPPPPLGVDVFTDGESGYKAFRIPGIAAAKGVVVVFAEGRKVRMPSRLYCICTHGSPHPCTTHIH
jgi:hypothetical protein